MALATRHEVTGMHNPQRDPFFERLWAEVQEGIDDADRGDLSTLRSWRTHDAMKAGPPLEVGPTGVKRGASLSAKIEDRTLAVVSSAHAITCCRLEFSIMA